MFTNKLLLFTTFFLFPAFTMVGCNAPLSSNTKPTINNIAGSTSVMPSSEVTLTCEAFDQDGDKLNYVWSSDNGTITGQGSEVIWLSPEVRGKYQVTATVDDGRSGTASYTKELQVVINADGKQSYEEPVVLRLSLPSDEIVTNNSKRIHAWWTIPIECIVDNPDGNKITYRWSAANGKLYAKEGLEEGTASSISWIAPGIGGDYTVDITVSDEHGNTARGAVKIKVICCGNL